MAREIKFRVKYEEYSKGEEWIYGYNMYAKEFQERTQSGSSYIHTDVDKSTLGQYIGLKDRNGKEIYEGDILRGDYYPLSDGDIKDNYLLVVEWSDYGAYFTANSYKRKGSTVQGISAGFENEITAEVVKQLEIAGNIYDNADMLYGWEE